MPQMMPINWIISFILFLIIFIMFNILNFYIFKPNKKNKNYMLFNLKKKYFNWKW